MRRLLISLSAALLLLTCSKSRGAGDIVIGEYGSMTGSEATFGQSTHNGITLALEEINGTGGVHGHPLRVVSEDDQSKSEEAASAVSKLISQNGVRAVIGEVASSCSLAAAPICQGARVPMITPSSTNPAITQKGDYIFRMCFIDNYQGPVLARFVMQQLHASRIALFTDVRSDYSTGLAAAFEKTLTSLGGQIVVRQSYAKGDSDFRPQLTAIKNANPQIVFVPGYYNDVGAIAVHARDIGITVPLLGGDGWESPKLLEIGGKSLEGCMYANHYHADDPAPAVHAFVDKYTRRFGAKPDSLAALGYDAAGTLADAMKRAPAGFDNKDLRDALATTKDFRGVTGDITFGPDRNPIGKKVVIEEIRNGQLVLRATVLP